MVRSRAKVAAVIAAVIVFVIGGASVVTAPAAALTSSTQLQAAADARDNCALLAAHATGDQLGRAQDCVADQEAIIALLGGTTTTSAVPPVTTTTTTTTAPPVTTTTTTPPVTTTTTAAPPPVELNCAPLPSRCGYPDATNTGVPAGTALTVVNGGMTIRTAGAVVDGMDIRGCVVVAAAHVTIRRSKVTCSNAWAIRSYRDDYTAGGLLIEDVTVSCADSPGTGIASYGFVARRVDVSRCENGFAIDNDVTVEDSYVHGLFIGSGGHTDGMQFAGGAHVTIRHNTILNPNDGGTSAIIMSETRMSDVLVQNNLMAGGAYTVYCPRDSSTNVRVLGNRFSKLYKPKGGEYGPWVYCGQVSQVAGNIWDDTGRPLPV